MTYELYHHGILGQKWGVRRYQNPDGTLTDAGRKRYYNKDGSLTKAGRKAYYNPDGTLTEAGRARKKAIDRGIDVSNMSKEFRDTYYSGKSASELSTIQLRERNARMKADIEYRENIDKLIKAKANEKIEDYIRDQKIAQLDQKSKEYANYQKMAKGERYINAIGNLAENSLKAWNAYNKIRNGLNNAKTADNIVNAASKVVDGTAKKKNKGPFADKDFTDTFKDAVKTTYGDKAADFVERVTGEVVYSGHDWSNYSSPYSSAGRNYTQLLLEDKSMK